MINSRLTWPGCCPRLEELGLIQEGHVNRDQAANISWTHRSS